MAFIPTITTYAQSDESVKTEASSSSDDTVRAVEDGFPVFTNEQLVLGRDVWMANCRNCHERGVADAPIVKRYEAWEPRINKGKATLYEHAIGGFFGEDDSMMPAKGGNEELTDDQVKSAVDYMVATAIYYKTTD